MSGKRSIKMLGLALVAALAFSAVAAGAAQANTPRWKVNGAYLGSGVKKAFTVTSGKSTLSAPNLGLTIVCTSDKGSGSIIGSEAGSPGLDEGSVTYEGCSVEKAAECQVHSPGAPVGTIKTVALKSELVWLTELGNEAGVRLFPASGTTFVEIAVEECAAEQTEPLPVTGEVVGKVLPVATEVETGELVFPSPAITTYWTGDKPSRTKHTLSNSLHFGGQPATYVSTEKVTLTEAGSKYGVFE
jgi:hypothetical protein